MARLWQACVAGPSIGAPTAAPRAVAAIFSSSRLGNDGATQEADADASAAAGDEDECGDEENAG